MQSREASSWLIIGMFGLMGWDFPGRVNAAETGDLDGDGRISIRDVIHLQRDLPPAPGSFEAIRSGGCMGGGASASNLRGRSLIYLESLRRNVPGSYPSWFPLDPRWIEDIQQPSLPQDPRCKIRLEPVEALGGAGDEVFLRFHLSVEAPVRAFSLVLEADQNIIQVPFLKHVQCDSEGDWWDERAWYSPSVMSVCHSHNLDSIPVFVMPPASLITAGRYVVTFGLPFDTEAIQPGDHTFTVDGRLPKGTPAGHYRLRVREGSEVLFEDGVLASPSIVDELSEVVLLIRSDVTSGFDGVVPAIDFDVAGRRVLGRVEFRIVDWAGNPGTEEIPVEEGLPGDEVLLRVQMRTEIPLNDLFFMVNWPAGSLSCSGLRASFLNPEDGQLYQPFPTNGIHKLPRCEGSSLGRSIAWFRLAGAWSTPGGDPGNNYIERLFEHFKPLKEWTDLIEFRVRISEFSERIIPLKFARYHRTVPGELRSTAPTHFAPYFADWPCNTDDKPPGPLWNYDLTYHDTFIEVLRFEDPPPPPDAELDFVLGSANGKPGDLIEVPVLTASQVSANLPLGLLRLVVRSDPQNLIIEAVDTWFLNKRTNEKFLIRAARGGNARLLDCIDADGDGTPDQVPCPTGQPFYCAFHDTEFDLARIEWIIDHTFLPPFPPQDLVEIARLLVKIAPTATARNAVISGGLIKSINGGLEVDIVSGGGFVDFDGRFSPARKVEPARITILGEFDKPFVRGDANQDSQVDLSDAVYALGYLFLGEAEPGCLRAADMNDDGNLEITDPVFLLGTLFLGEGQIPAPSPACGPDPTPDALTCLESLCPGE